jgi:hypothetical protein
MSAVDSSTERPAEPGELCTCGRQARTVFLTRRWGEVGSCGTDRSGELPVLPCPFCGASEAHQVGGEVVKCPQYRLRVLDDLTDEARLVLNVVHADLVPIEQIEAGDYVSTAPPDMVGKAVFRRVKTVDGGACEFEPSDTSAEPARMAVVCPPGAELWRATNLPKASS